LNPMPSSSFASLFRRPMLFLVGNVIILGFLGAAPLASPQILAGKIATTCYFGYFILLMPIFGWLEATLSLATSIGRSSR
jgi:ubiquinol-cytochrome c reductase cytochrome b subunit